MAAGAVDASAIQASRSTETDLAITEYATKNSGFMGTLKYRYSDFIVREVAMDGTVVKLRDKSSKTTVVGNQAKEPTTSGQADGKSQDRMALLTEIVGPEQAAKVLELEKSGEGDTPGEPVVLAPDADKSRRTAVHQLVREHFPSMASDSTKVGEKNETAIRVFLKAGSVDKFDNGRPFKRQKKGSLDGSIFQANRHDPLAKGMPYTKFTLYKENMDTMSAISLLAKITNVKTNVFQYAGTKDRRACTAQEVTALRVEPGRLAGLNKSLRFGALGDFKRCKEALRLGDLRGNRFEIVLRDVAEEEAAVAAACAELQRRGFINYYGLQRFGSSSVPTHAIGKALMKGEWEAAADLILLPREGEKEETQKARELWKETRDPSAALRAFPRWMHSERAALEGYKRQGKSAHNNAISAIPRNVRLMYLHAYQSYVWNRMASERVRLLGLESAAEGDLVLVEDAEDTVEEVAEEGGEAVGGAEGGGGGAGEGAGEAGAEKWLRAHPKKVKALTAAEAAQTSIFQVVLPLPGISVQYPTNAIGQRYREVIQADGLDIDNLKNKVREYTMTGDYRKLMGKPADVEWEFLRYKNPRGELQATDMDELRGKTIAMVREEGDRQWEAGSEKRKAEGGEEGEGGEGEERRGLRVGFTLKSSQYATMCLRELLKEHSNNAQWGAAPPGAWGPSKPDAGEAPSVT